MKNDIVLLTEHMSDRDYEFSYGVFAGVKRCMERAKDK